MNNAAVRATPTTYIASVLETKYGYAINVTPSSIVLIALCRFPYTNATNPTAPKSVHPIKFAMVKSAMSHHLEDEPFEILGLRNRRQNRMVRRLGEHFYQSQRLLRIDC